MDNVQLREFSFVQWRQQDRTPVVNALNEHQFSRFSNENTNIVAISILAIKPVIARWGMKGVPNTSWIDRTSVETHQMVFQLIVDVIQIIRIWRGRDPNLVWAGSEFGVDGIQVPFRSIQLPTSDAQCSGTHQRC